MFLEVHNGLYTRVEDSSSLLINDEVACIIEVFHAGDLHTPRAPQVPPPILAAAAAEHPELDALSQYPRVTYVAYVPTQAAQRTGGISVTPHTIFGNQTAHSAYGSNAMTITEHGAHIMGSRKDAATQLAKEVTMRYLNDLATIKLALQFSSPLNTLLSQIIDLDPSRDGNEIDVDLCPFDAMSIEDHALVIQYRGYYRWLYDLINSMGLQITKNEFRKSHALLKSIVDSDTPPTDEDLFPSSERVPLFPQPQLRELPGIKTTLEVKDSRFEGGQVSDG